MSIAWNHPSISQILWYQQRAIESPIDSPQRQEWIRIKREVEETAKQFWTEKEAPTAIGAVQKLK